MSTIVFTFGRMNPPTKGHELLISKVLEVANLNNADHVVYLSQSQNARTDPLGWNFKRRVCSLAFNDVNISDDVAIKNPYMALEHLKDLYNNIILVAGDDRVAEYRKWFEPYAAGWDVDLKVVSAGCRVTESTDVAGVSASKMRQFAKENNLEMFTQNMPTKLTFGIRRLVFDDTRRALKLA